MATTNRLQFIHCDTLFKTREEAKAYIADKVIAEQPALYAEPMVLKYGEEANPNVILAIGSNGDGQHIGTSNKVFLMDFAALDESIKALQADSSSNDQIKTLLEKVIAACGINADGTYAKNAQDETLSGATSLNEADALLSKAVKEHYDELKTLIGASALSVKDSATVTLKMEAGESGKTLSADAKLAPYRTISSVNVPNIILTQEDGLYASVRMEYDAESNTIKFYVNEDEKAFALPTEVHLETGAYDTTTESIILTLTNGNKISVDCNKLISEWTVLGEDSDTPIVLTREAVTNKENRRGGGDYQGILKADVRLAEDLYPEVTDNILKRYNKNTLYVKGTADNIVFYQADGSKTTVQDAIQKPKVSTREYNILQGKEDGLYVRAKLSYDETTNILRYDDGVSPEQVIKLQSPGILQGARYDIPTESIILTFTYVGGELKEVEIPVSDLITEWEPNNEFHTVKLERKRNPESPNGTDQLSADVIISDADNNILEVVNHALYVKGTAANIRYKDGTVKQALDNIATTDNVTELKELIDQEVADRKAADDEIRKIANDSMLQASGVAYQVNANKEAIAAEEAERKEHDRLIGDAVSGISKDVEDAKTQVATLTNDLTSFKETAQNVHNQLASAVTSLNGDVQANKEAIATNVTNLTEVSGDLANHIAEADSKFAEIEGKTDTLNEKAVANEAAITTLSGTVSAHATEANAKFDALNAKDTQLQDAITAEVQRSTNADTAISGAVDTVSANVATAQAGIAKNTQDIADLNQRINDINVSGVTSAELDKEISDLKNELTGQISTVESALKAEDARLAIVPQGTSTIQMLASKTASGTLVSGNVKIDVKTGNIITSSGDGLYAKLALDYNKATNTMDVLVNDVVSQTITFSDHSLVQEGHYDSASKSIILTIVKDGGETQQISIPVADLVDEWRVDNGTDNPIVLSKVTGEDGVDVLSARLAISTDENNAILNNNGTLYVSNEAKDLTALWGGDEITIQKAIENLKAETDKVAGIEADVDALQSGLSEVQGDIISINGSLTTMSGQITNLQTRVDQNTQNIAQNSGSITTLTNQVTNLASDVTNLTDSFNDLKTTVEGYENRITNLESGITNINENIQNITNQINDIQDQIGGSGEGPSILDRLDAIEKELANLIDFGYWPKEGE